MSLKEENQKVLTYFFPNYQTAKMKNLALKETTALFQQFNPAQFHFPKRRWFYRPLLSKRKNDYSTDVSLEAKGDGVVVPHWFPQLEREYDQLKKSIQKTISVVEFGAVGDGKTDCTKAFKRALSSGRREVTVPAGVFLVREIKVPSMTILTGRGSAETTIKLHDEAPKKQRLLTNRYPNLGNHHLEIKELTLDWNVERLSEYEATAAGGTTSSGVTLAHVKYAWVHDLVIKNPGLHGVDVTAPRYSYQGDGTRARGGSEFIWLDQIEAFGYGDDGITTHHSQHILISNSYLHHPSGRAHAQGFSNSNGIEVDDGSQHISLVNNRTAYGFGGVEIKAHETSSAAADTQICGHYSFHDNRAYNFRHIGHHKGEDLFSCSAYGIRGTFLVADSPQYTELYLESTPRCLVVSAYQQVVMNYFVGKMNLSTPDEKVAIAIQYRASQVKLHQIHLERYSDCQKAVRVSQDTKQVEVYFD